MPVLNLSTLGLIVCGDQLLLPMFHFAGMPFKFSYFVLGLWFIHLINGSGRTRDGHALRDFILFSSLIGGIISCAIVGEIWLGAWHQISTYSELYRSLAIYALIILSFGLGRHIRFFDFKILYYVLAVSVSLNLIFILFRSGIPSWILDIYYPSMYVQDINLEGVTSARDVLEIARPRGLFGNPNQSALMINIISLAICLSLRNNLLVAPKRLMSIFLIFGPVIVSGLVASRGEFIVSAVLGYLNFRYAAASLGNGMRIFSTLSIVLFPAILVYAVITNKIPPIVGDNIDRVVTIVNILDTPSSGDQKSESVARPLVFLDLAMDRATNSIVFGTGFSSSNYYPYQYITQYYHNDWLRLLVTSGLLGVVAMIYLIWRFCYPLGWPSIIPFFLPGIVNTFMLSIPAVIFYFLMVGAMQRVTAERRS